MPLLREEPGSPKPVRDPGAQAAAQRPQAEWKDGRVALAASPAHSQEGVADRSPNLSLTESVRNSGPDPRVDSRFSPAIGAAGGSRGLAGILSSCANPDCGTGWLHLWRSRSAPVFEGGWSCSPACTAARLESAVRRELDGRRDLDSRSEQSPTHRHRIPLGLVMLEQGWISSSQLREALTAQKAAGQGKLGKWLVRQQGISEQMVTRALSLQWSCPVLSLESHDPEHMASALPRLFLDAFAALPLRVAGGSILYLGFEDRLDPVLALAAERMLGLRVEAGLMPGSLFQPAHQRMLKAAFPRAELIEAPSSAPLGRILARVVERQRPVESRLVRLHDCLWLRLWTRPQLSPLAQNTGVEDVICSLSSG